MPCWRGDFHSPAASRLACLRGLRGAVRVNTRGGTLGNLRANGASSPDSAPQAGLITGCSAGPRLPMPERRGEGREVRVCKRGTECGLPVRRIYRPRACSLRAQGLYMARRGCPVGAEISTVPLRVVLLAGAGCAARCAWRGAREYAGT